MPPQYTRQRQLSDANYRQRHARHKSNPHGDLLVISQCTVVVYLNEYTARIIRNTSNDLHLRKLFHCFVVFNLYALNCTNIALGKMCPSARRFSKSCLEFPLIYTYQFSDTFEIT